MAEFEYRVIGAGPAGLVAATALARAGRQVAVYERTHEVGHRFSGDFQGLENWSEERDAMERLADLGIEPSFEHRGFHEVTFYGADLRPVVARSERPRFYLVRRGPEDGTLDRALLAQAQEAGAEILFDHQESHAYRGDIVATGPRYADGIASGFVFPTDLPDQAHCIISDEFAPAGYAYLLIWGGRATMATCLFRRHDGWREARTTAAEAFIGLVPGLDVSSARSFSGFGSVFDSPRLTDEAGRIYVGEAAGLQDPEWGFGMWYAMESGLLAARSLLDGADYPGLVGSQLIPRQQAAFFNRLLFEGLPAGLVPPLLRRIAGERDLRPRLRRHWAPHPAKRMIARIALPGFSRRRLRHRDRACHSETCDCLWCTHGSDGASRSST